MPAAGPGIHSCGLHPQPLLPFGRKAGGAQPGGPAGLHAAFEGNTEEIVRPGWHYEPQLRRDHINPPYTPENVYQMESSAAAPWGFDGVHFTITDHDEFAGSLALLRGRTDLSSRVAIGEELSLWY